MQDILDACKTLGDIGMMNKKEIFFIAAVGNDFEDNKIEKIKNLIIAKNYFGDVINTADIVIGLSGTGNEQAAGLGKPVISFPGRGVQYTSTFAKRQTQLLGSCLTVTKRNSSEIAKTAWEILNNKEKRQRMATEGMLRMGVSGASKKIANKIISEYRI